MLNKIMLIGNLGRDPEMSYTQSGKAVTKFTMAVNRRRKNRETGAQEEETQWFNIVAWDNLAETCHTYLHKGSKIYLEGRMTSRKYTDKDGVERTAWEVVAEGMQML
ncbi:MAG TPA: single-stranded DNA-binding protein, partial [Ktedonobacterales bacterium]|nr:single-stranded DNA-binding protein [Ktedonobacterales bacterium]